MTDTSENDPAAPNEYTGSCEMRAEIEFVSEEVKSTELTGSCENLAHPGLWGISGLKTLKNDYGWGLLIMISLSSQWCKGFCRSQYVQSVRYLLQDWMVSGPRLDALTSIIEIPWSLKPMLALCSDLFPLFGYSKNPYIFLSTVLGVAGLCMGSFVDPLQVSVLVPTVGLFLAMFAWMTSDILVEGVYSCRMGQNPSSGPLLIVYVNFGQQIAVFVSSLICGIILEKVANGAQLNIALCLIPTGLLLIPTCLNFLGEEKKFGSVWKSVLSTQKSLAVLSACTCVGSLVFVGIGMAQIGDSGMPLFVTGLVVLCVINFLCYALLQPLVGRLVIFLAIASVCNLSIGGAAHYFYTDSPSVYPEGPNFDPWFFVTICGIVGAIGCMCGSLIFACFQTAKYTHIYTVLIVLNTILSLPNCVLFSRLNIEWGISDYWFVASDTALQSAMNVLYFIPGYLLLSRICPNRLESTMFAILASNTNLAQTIAFPISAYICEAFSVVPCGDPTIDPPAFANLWKANLVIATLKLVPLLFIPLLPKCRMTETVISSNESVCRKR